MRIGLALGGGVSRGLAHIGVLKVLEREQIPICCIAGTSVGSIIGAFYAAGHTAAEIQEAAVRIQWWHIARPVLSTQGLVSFGPLEAWVTKALDDIDIADLGMPFAAVATDIEKGEPVVFRSGRVAPAVRASSSVPGLVCPREIDGRLCCDGGISDNLPISAARALGADFVIGVNLFDPLFTRPRHMFSIALESVITLVRRAGGGVQGADCLITPDLRGQSYIRLSKIHKLELIRRGEEATEAASIS